MLPIVTVKAKAELPTSHNTLLAKIGVRYRVSYNNSYRAITYFVKQRDKNGEVIYQKEETLFDNTDTKRLSTHNRVFYAIIYTPPYNTLLFDNVRDLIMKVIKIDIEMFVRAKSVISDKMTLMGIFWRYYFHIIDRTRRLCRRTRFGFSQNFVIYLWHSRRIYVHYGANCRIRAFPNTHLLYNVASLVAIKKYQYVDILYGLLWLIRTLVQKQIVESFAQKMLTGVDTIGDGDGDDDANYNHIF